MGGDLGRGAVGEAGRLQRAARLVEGVAHPLRRQRPAGGRAGRPVRGLDAPSAPRPRARSGRSPPGSTTAQSSSRRPAGCGATRAGRLLAARKRLEGRLGGVGIAELEDEHRGPLADPERRQPVADVVRRRAGPRASPARTSPASRRSVSRATRSRISSSATTTAACCTQSRSKSPSSPERRTTTSQASAAPPRGEPGWASARPRRSDCGGTKGAAAEPRGWTSRAERLERPPPGGAGRRAPGPRRARRAPASCRRPPRRSRGRSRRARRPQGPVARAAR